MMADCKPIRAPLEPLVEHLRPAFGVRGQAARVELYAVGQHATQVAAVGLGPGGNDRRFSDHLPLARSPTALRCAGPSPADMVGYGFDADRVLSILRRDLVTCRESHVDITLKDVETMQGDSRRAAEFVRLCRQVIDELWG